MNKYEAKQQARRARLEASAERARSAASMHYTRAKTMASAIPSGQPILVGHHSEGRDRRYRARVHATFGKAFALHDQAAELDRRAAAAGKGGISSDDPEAPDKLRAKLADMEERHERMKRTNALIRREDRAGLERMGYSADAIDKLFQPDWRGRPGFASYELTNNSANIRRVRERIAALEKMAECTDRQEEGQGCYTYREDIEDNRAVFLFDAKPKKAVRDLMKRNAFVFSPTRSPAGKSAYLRKLTPNAIATAKWLRPQLDELMTGE